MLGVAAAVYLLLALRVRVLAQAYVCGMRSGAALEIGAAGVALRFDGVLRLEGARLRLLPRYGKEAGRSQKTARQKTLLRSVRRLLIGALRRDEYAQLTIQARVGLGDAEQTALASGALRAAARSACVMLDLPKAQISILPDYGGAQLTVNARCIFFFQTGDIMLAAVREMLAARKTGKEGLGWKSIPLRA